jgi:hypothetical protein
MHHYPHFSVSTIHFILKCPLYGGHIGGRKDFSPAPLRWRTQCDEHPSFAPPNSVNLNRFWGRSALSLVISRFQLMSNMPKMERCTPLGCLQVRLKPFCNTSDVNRGGCEAPLVALSPYPSSGSSRPSATYECFLGDARCSHSELDLSRRYLISTSLFGHPSQRDPAGCTCGEMKRVAPQKSTQRCCRHT